MDHKEKQHFACNEDEPVVKAYRILPDDPTSRHLYWAFEDRVRAFILKYEPEAGADAAIRFLRGKWISAPEDTGYWIGMEGSTPVAHCAAYIDMHGDQLYVNLWQVWVNEGGGDLIGQVGGEIREWVRGYNLKLGERGMKFITYGESLTWHSPYVHERLFRTSGLRPKVYRTMYRWSFD
jgi:hypothetical protein